MRVLGVGLRTFSVRGICLLGLVGEQRLRLYIWMTRSEVLCT